MTVATIEIQRGFFIQYDEIRELVRDLRQCNTEDFAIQMLIDQMAAWNEMAARIKE